MSVAINTGNFKAWFRKYGNKKVDDVFPILEETYLGEFDVPTGTSAYDHIVAEVGIK